MISDQLRRSLRLSLEPGDWRPHRVASLPAREYSMIESIDKLSQRELEAVRVTYVSGILAESDESSLMTGW